MNRFRYRIAPVLATAAACLFATSHAAHGQDGEVPQDWIGALSWRSIGPANMGGRITALAVFEADPSTWWAATASGGLLKTTNNGITFEHQFDHEATVSIGHVAVAPSNRDVVWVGTGESNPRNSVSWGNGVYKSLDGGATWEHMGLDNTYQTGRIVIHPENPDIVYVGTLGRLWGPNEDRGLYKTTDGGTTWEKIHYIDDKTGVIDMQMHPADPDTLIIATYERERDGFDTNDPAKRWGPGSGLHKTTDGGANWKKLTEGLPSGELGRIGLDYYRANPDTIIAVIESDVIGKEPENAPYLGAAGEDAEVGAKLTDITEEGPAAAAELMSGDIVIRIGEATVTGWQQFLREVRQHVAGDTVELEIVRDREAMTIEMTFGTRPGVGEEAEEEVEGPRRPGGQQRRSPFAGSLGGQAENLQDQQGPDGAEHGGIYRSDDGGESWTRINSLNPRPMYFSQIRIDPSDDQHIYVLGISLYKSKDGGETFTGDGHRGENGSVHVDHHALWIDPSDGRHQILGNDGGLYITYDRMVNWDHHNHMAIGQFYHVGVDSTRDYNVYGGLQDNGSWGAPNMSRTDSGPINSDWMSIGGGDGFLCLVDEEDPDQIYFESQNGGMGSINLRTGARGFMRPRAPQGERYRFNWRTPFQLSHHNSRIYYTVGNHVFRSLDRGSALRAISPEITKGDRGSGTAFAESSLDPDVLYVGTDDGALWMTRNGGHDWTNLYEVDPDEVVEEPEPERRGPGAGRGGRGGAGGAGGAGGGGGGGGPGGRGGGGAGGGRFGGGDPAARIERMIERFDANEDGSVTREEMPERARQMFDTIDQNSDGVLNAKDIPAAGAETDAAEAQDTGTERPRRRGGRRPDGPEGRWAARITREGATDEESRFELNIDSELVATITSPMFNGTSIRSQLSNNELTFVFDVDGEEARLTATLDGDRMEGRIIVAGGFFTMPFEAERQRAPRGAGAGTPEPAEPTEAASVDPISGEWTARILSEEMPGGQTEMSMKLTLGEDGSITGFITTSFSEGPVTSGSFNVETGRLRFVYETDQFEVNYDAKVGDDTMQGTGDVGGGMFQFEFEANRTATPGDAAATADEPVFDWKPIAELVPDARWVNCLEASRHEPGRVYVAFDGHRSNDDEPHIYLSIDYGRTWRPIRSNLPTSAGTTRVIREDIVHPDMLYLGTEFGLWVSFDRGGHWMPMKSNLPTVAIHEVAQHPSSGEVVVATHGRSLWILDVTPLRHMTSERLGQPVIMAPPKDAYHWRRDRSRGRTIRRFVGQNPPNGAVMNYALREGVGTVSMRIYGAGEDPIRVVEDLPKDPGLHSFEWDLRRAARAGQGQGQGRGGRGGRGRRGPLVASGTYRVVLIVDGEEYATTLDVRVDPEFPDYQPWAAEEFEEVVIED